MTKRKPTDRSKVVEEMKERQRAMKGPAIDSTGSTPNYPWQGAESSKLRVCLSECAEVIAEAIIEGARIIAGTPKPEDDNPWRPVSDCPIGQWVETRRKVGENCYEGGTNICLWVKTADGDKEWVERVTGRTTVTSYAFAAPTEWRWPPESL